jgi:hypothetical protein
MTAAVFQTNKNPRHPDRSAAEWRDRRSASKPNICKNLRHPDRSAAEWRDPRILLLPLLLPVFFKLSSLPFIFNPPTPINRRHNDQPPA